MSNRLATVEASLSDDLTRRTPSQLRRIAATAALLAIRRTGLSDPRLNDALSLLHSGNSGEDEQWVVDRLTEELNEKAWDIQEQADVGNVSQQTYLEMFSKARAAAAVGFALSDNALESALEAVYEAYAAVGDLDAIQSAIQLALEEPTTLFFCGYCRRRHSCWQRASAGHT